jgi:hypothetical protein
MALVEVEPARHVQPADSRLEEEPPLGRGLHQSHAGVTHGSDAEYVRPTGDEADFAGSPCPQKTTESELRGEKLFFGKAQCASCHPAPSTRQPDAGSAPRALRARCGGRRPDQELHATGIKDSPPYLHDGRLLTLEDTVEFFNLVLTLKLTKQEKQDLVAFLRQL